VTAELPAVLRMDQYAWRRHIRDGTPLPPLRSSAASLPVRVPMVPVQRGIVDELRSALGDYDQAPEGQRGQCADDVLQVVRALLDETPQVP
jgi:hypothetical protein